MIKRIIKSIVNLTGYVLVKNIDNELENASDFDKDIIKKFSKYTMTSNVKIFTLIKAIKYVNKFKINGDFVECGVYTGGNIMIMKKLIKKGIKRKIFAYDTFEGMVTPTSYDVKIDGTIAKKKYLKTDSWVRCSLNKVKENFKEMRLNLKNVKFVKGKVENTLKIKKNLPKKISILRLDTDFYESTKIELKILFPLLVKGGVLIIDDYGSWLGSKKATDEYFERKKNFLYYIDHSARMIIK
jgi:O-methyltransferase